MSLPVQHDGTRRGDPMERCCNCRVPTRTWYAPKDVALCHLCANLLTEDRVPSKRLWLAKERALTPATLGSTERVPEPQEVLQLVNEFAAFYVRDLARELVALRSLCGRYARLEELACMCRPLAGNNPRRFAEDLAANAAVDYVAGLP